MKFQKNISKLFFQLQRLIKVQEIWIFVKFILKWEEMKMIRKN